MFEGVIASVLNRYLGKYVEDLDLESLNIGIFSGSVVLENLKLKAEALYELNLPIVVKFGTIGKLSLNIPWNRLCNQTSVITIEEIFILASPVTVGTYEHDIEKKLLRAEKKKILETLDPSGSFLSDDGPNKFAETLITSILNNLKVHIHNIHIRYEDMFTNIHLPVSFGICIYSFSVETTNSKWRPISHSSKSGSVYQVIKIDSFSVYCNANCAALLLNDRKVRTNNYWYDCMKHSLETFKLFEEPFDFLIRPISIRLKIIINKLNEVRTPKLLIDFVLQDAALQLTHKQYHALFQLQKSFHRISLNRLYRKFHPGVPVSGNVKQWWKYAYEAVNMKKIQPLTWSHLLHHRKNYREYCRLYKKLLLDSSNTELKLDLQKIEDNLDIYNIIMAREFTKMQVRREFPDKIELKEQSSKLLFNLFSNNSKSKKYKFHIKDRKNGIWNLLSQTEKNSLCEMIGYSESDISASDSPNKQYIEYKFNFTIANLNITLMSGGSETAVLTLTHVLLSIETRPSVDAYKISTRIGTVLVEGASVEYTLIPVITSENILNSKLGSNFLMLDFEKNPPNNEVNYSLSISTESLEVLYHEFSVSSFISFLQIPALSAEITINWITEKFKYIVNKIATNSISRRFILQLNIDMKLPYFIIPEYGSLQKNGNIIILDSGRVKMWSDLQIGNMNLDEATQLELEEKLYDRFYFSLTDFQILIFNNGQSWRNFKKISNLSQYCILSKVQLQVVFSSSIKPENKQITRYKVNVSLQKLKISLSDTRIVNLLSFYNNFLYPKCHTVLDNIEDDLFLTNDEIIEIETLEWIQYSIANIETGYQSPDVHVYDKEYRKSFLFSEKNCLQSDISDEDSETWSRMLDLPGFDDNVSENNIILYLLRVHIVQIIVEMRRNCNNIDKSYIIIQLKNFCWDTAFMEYGPAIQISLQSFNVFDKLHGLITSDSVVLFSTEGNPDVLTIFYRKVKSNCPDFKSHYHSTEQSLVIDVNKILITFHKEAMIDLLRFMKYFSHKFKNWFLLPTVLFVRDKSLQFYNMFINTLDPPIPPGAIKFSYSVRVLNFQLQLCDTEIGFLLTQISGFELNCVFKANEKFLFRMYLMNLTIDDISNTSLYSKILNIEEEKLMEVKYVHHTTYTSKTNLEGNQNDIKSDGSFKFHFGRIHLVVIFKLIFDLQKFFSPFISMTPIKNMISSIGHLFNRLYLNLYDCLDKIHLAIDVQLPSILLPRQLSSPNMIVFNAGDLTVENFFKELVIEEKYNQKLFPIVNNILIKLNNVSVSRAIVNFNGSIIVQETIMEPICCKVDVKRILSNIQVIDNIDSLSILDINIRLDHIIVNLGQKDFSILNHVWFENIKKILYFYYNTKKNSKLEGEIEICKIQTFFYQTESTGNRKNLTLHANMERIVLCLYNDIDEIISSPIRDETKSLCKLQIGEIVTHGLFYANGRHENQISVQSILMEDTRSAKTINIRKIFQSYGATYTQSNNENICITVPPVISISICKNHKDESRCDILIDHTRLNLGVSFVMELTKFFMEDTLKEYELQKNNGIINYGYVNESIDTQNEDNDCESLSYSKNYYSFIIPEDSEGFSLSISCRKPEIMFFSQTEDFTKNHALLLRTDLSIEFIQHASNVSFTCNVADMHVLSKLQSTLVKTSSNIILEPCNIVISKNWISSSEEVKISLTCDAVDIHISASTIHTVLNIMNELNSYLSTDSLKKQPHLLKNAYQEVDNLWSAKKITPYCLPQVQESYMDYSNSRVLSETMIISLPSAVLMYELEDIVQKKPVLLLKLCAEAKVRNWSSALEIKGDVSLQCSYLNFNVNSWEPVIEPSSKIGDNYRPWEISIKAFKSKSYPISTILRYNYDKKSESKKGSNASSTKFSIKEEAENEMSENEDNSCESVETVKKKNSILQTNNSRPDLDSYEYSDTESESGNEDAVMEKLKLKFGQLLTGESSDENDTDSETSLNELSCNKQSDDTSDSDALSHNTTSNSFLLEKRVLFITKQRESIESGIVTENNDKAATYFILEATERFELVITSCTISVLQQIFDSFSLKYNNILTDAQFLSLKNDIAPGSNTILYSKSAIGPMKVLMNATYNLSSSSPSSRNSTFGSLCDIDNHSDSEFNSGIENFEGGFAPDAYSILDIAKVKSDENILVQALQFPSTSIDSIYNKIMSHQLQINVPGFDELTVVCPMRRTNKYHTLHPIKNNTRYHIIISVQNDLWGNSITVRSPLQLKNETCFTLSLYYKKSALDNTGFENIGEVANPFKDTYKFAVIEPDEIYNVPIMIAYHCPIYIVPIYQEYQLSETYLWWKELVNNVTATSNIVCKPKDENLPVFVIRALITEGVKLSNVCARSMPNFLIRLLPSVVIYNLLPCALQIKIPSADFFIRIEAGGKSSVYSIDLTIKQTIQIEVPIYFGITWNGVVNIYDKVEEKLVSMTTDQDTDGGNKYLSLNVKLEKNECNNILIYAPYWIVNKTGLPLQLRASSSDNVHETFAEEPLFFAFRKTQKRCIRLRIYQSSWSAVFSADTIGCASLVTCRDRERNRKYRILAEISLSNSSPQLTKIITLLPYFLLQNECKIPIKCMEENEHADLWIDLPLNQTTPFWPEMNSMKMYVKFRDSSLVSQHFFINQVGQTVLRMDEGTALVVEIIGGVNEPFLLIFRDYKYGDAPVRIDNYCEDLFLKISQENLGQVTLLSPYQSLLYTWDDPCAERKLQWNVYNSKNKGFIANFKIDGYGQEFVSFKLIREQNSGSNSSIVKGNTLLSSSLRILTKRYSIESSSSIEESELEDSLIKTRKGKVVVFWISYLEGPQRVLLFTQDEQLAYYAYSRIDSEKSNLEIFIALKGIGLSLISDVNDVSQELSYISINDSSSIWEVNIAHSWKILPLELATWIEHQWSQGVKKAQLKDYIYVDLEKMQLKKPFFGELKRSYKPALWIHGRKSYNYFYIQWKIHKFQIDNQLPNSVFQSILHSKVIPYDVIRKYGLKPCLEGTVLKKINSCHHDKNIYKYIKFNAMEFCLQLDKQFVFSVCELMHPWIKVESSSLKIRADICKVYQPLVVKFSKNPENQIQTIIEYCYFSPIKIQFSCPPQNVERMNNKCNTIQTKAYLQFAINCLNTTFVDFKKTKLKCPFYEEFGIVTYSRLKLKQIKNSYLSTLLRQIYLRIFGPDIISNSDCDIDFCEELTEFYYDLTMSFSKNTDEIAEAISESAQCLLSYVNTSAVSLNSSLITCGKRTSLDLGLNPELIKKRLISHRSSLDEPEEILKGNYCFEVGVLHGVSGFSMNSLNYTHQGDIELFFKTVGKHLLRLLSKYSDTVNNISVTIIDGIRRAAEVGSDITFQARLPKYVNSFCISPYLLHHSIGLHILNSINKGLYATDTYWTHIVLTHDGKSCLLITLQRIFFIVKAGLWDDWKIEWCVNVNDIIEVPQMIDNKLLLKISEEEPSRDIYNDNKFIKHDDVNILFWIQKMIEIVFIINLENKPCLFAESYTS